MFIYKKNKKTRLLAIFSVCFDRTKGGGGGGENTSVKYIFHSHELQFIVSNQLKDLLLEPLL